MSFMNRFHHKVVTQTSFKARSVRWLSYYPANLSSTIRTTAWKYPSNPLLLKLELPIQSLPNLYHSFKPSRFYASKKSKKSKTNSKKNSDEDDEDTEKSQPSEDKQVTFELEEFDPKFKACIERLKYEFQSLRLGRANAGILDPVQVDCGENMGGLMPLNQVGQVTVKDPQNLLVNVFDTQLLQKVEKAILSANLNLNPLVENGRIRVPIPKLTSQARETLVKQANVMNEKAKNAVRAVRQAAMKQLGTVKKAKNSGISADEIKQLEKKIDVAADKNIKDLNNMTLAKIAEIKG